MRRLARLPGDEEKQHQRGISTVDESALAVGDQGANVDAERTGAALSVPDRDELQRRGEVGVETPTTITATATPAQPSVEDDVTIAGHLTSSIGADMVAVPVVLYNTDDPANKVRTATTTDAFGRYQFTVTDSVATTLAIVCAESRSAYSRAQSPEVLVTYHGRRLYDTTQATLTPAAWVRTVFDLAWYELLAIFRNPMKLEARIKLNDVSIKKLLVTCCRFRSHYGQ